MPQRTDVGDPLNERGGDMSARDERHGAVQVRATGRSLQADAVEHDAMTIAKGMILTYLATVGPAEVRDLPQAWPVKRHHVQHIVQQLVADGLAECLDGSRIIHARSSVRLTTAGRAARPQPAMELDTGTARLARSA